MEIHEKYILTDVFTRIHAVVILFRGIVLAAQAISPTDTHFCVHVPVCLSVCLSSVTFVQPA